MNKRRIAERGVVQDGVKRLKRPWWLAASSLKHSFVQLVAPALLFTFFLLRDRPYEPIDYLFATLCVVWIAMAAVSVVAFKRHPKWNESTFDPGPVTPGQLRMYGLVIGSLIVAGITCVVLAFALTTWSLCGVALFLFTAAFAAGSNVNRRAVRSQ